MARGVDMEIIERECHECMRMYPLVRPCEHTLDAANKTFENFPPSDEQIQEHYSAEELEQLSAGIFPNIGLVPPAVRHYASILVKKKEKQG
jgi:hypothetical protein